MKEGVLVDRAGRVLPADRISGADDSRMPEYSRMPCGLLKMLGCVLEVADEDGAWCEGGGLLLLLLLLPT